MLPTLTEGIHSTSNIYGRASKPFLPRGTPWSYFPAPLAIAATIDQNNRLKKV